MKAFAFLEHPLTIEQIKSYNPLIRIMPGFMIRPSLRKNPPFKVSKLKKVRSTQGREIEGFFISWPILTKHMLELKEEFILGKVIDCCHLAKQLGAGMLGLGGYLSTVVNRGYNTIAQNLKIPVTCGSAFTAWSVFETIYRTTRVRNIDLKKSTLAVIGATDSIGSLCARKFSAYVQKLSITSREPDKLEQLKETILHLNPIEIIIEEDEHRAVKDADIVVITGSPKTPLDIKELKPDAIVCDVSVPGNIVGKINSRRDITVVDGNLIKLPHPTKLSAYTGLPRGIIYAGMAETVLLVFAEKFVDYSLGDNINLDKLEEIADIAVQHGFEVWVPGAPVL
jgi:predicted amino acid dehydrogenase